MFLCHHFSGDPSLPAPIYGSYAAVLYADPVLVESVRLVLEHALCSTQWQLGAYIVDIIPCLVGHVCVSLALNLGEDEGGSSSPAWAQPGRSRLVHSRYVFVPWKIHVGKSVVSFNYTISYKVCSLEGSSFKMSRARYYPSSCEACSMDEDYEVVGCGQHCKQSMSGYVWWVVWRRRMSWFAQIVALTVGVDATKRVMHFHGKDSKQQGALLVLFA